MAKRVLEDVLCDIQGEIDAARESLGAAEAVLEEVNNAVLDMLEISDSELILKFGLTSDQLPIVRLVLGGLIPK